MGRAVARRHAGWCIKRSFSRAGYESLKAAQADLDHVRALLGLADADDAEGLAQIADLLETVADERHRCRTSRRSAGVSATVLT